MGDYNGCRLENVVPSFEQYVDIPTRRDNTLDLCYRNIINAFRGNSYPPLRLVDHSMVCLFPHYRQERKRQKPQSYSASQWTEDAITQLQGSLACITLDIFEGDLNEKLSIITGYIKFCIDLTIPANLEAPNLIP